MQLSDAGTLTLSGAPPDQLENLLDLIFDPQKGLGLNIVRYKIGRGSTRRTVPVHFDPGQVAGPARVQAGAGYCVRLELRFQPEECAAGRQEEGANRFHAFSLSPPWWMTVSGDVAGQPPLSPPPFLVRSR